jgi:hypothetical protein
MTAEEKAALDELKKTFARKIKKSHDDLEQAKELCTATRGLLRDLEHEFSVVIDRMKSKS